MNIGYQGIEGSNSEEVAHIYAKKNNIEDVVFVPLVNSKNVVEALRSRKIDIGVMATYNLRAGIVVETKEALENINLEQLEEIKIPIHHCVFVKQGAKKEDIKIIASHIQALGQTKENLEKLFPSCEKMEVEDTALAAKRLYEDQYGDDVAVVCRKNAGEIFNLKLLYENIEDDKENATLFGIYKITD